MKNKSLKPRGKLRTGRIVVNLTREEYEFVDRIGRDALFSTGKRLTNNKIIKTFIGVIRELKIDGHGLYSCEGLRKRLLVALGIDEDRRRFARFRKGINVSWRRLDSMARYEKGQTVDIGEGGFRVELKEKRKKGDVLEFTIVDPSMPESPIKALGRIVWTRKKGDGAGMEAGIGLTHIPQEDRERFKKLICEGLSVDEPRESLRGPSTGTNTGESIKNA